MVTPSPTRVRLRFQIEPLADPALRNCAAAQTVTTAFVDRAPRASSPRWLGTAVRFSPKRLLEELGWWCPLCDGPPRSAVGFHGQATSLPLRRCPPYHRSSPHQRAFNASRSLQPPPYSGAAESSCGRGIRPSSHTARQCPANLCHGPLAHTPPRPRRRSGAQPFAPSQHWQVKVAAGGASKGETRACLTAASIPHCTPAKLVRCPHRALSCQPRCQRRASPSTRPARGGGGPAVTRPDIASQKISSG